MKRIHCSPGAALCATALLTLTACEAQKSENPLSPSVAGPIPGVEITAPGIVEPSQGTKVKESQQPIRLSVANAGTSGVRPLAYTFEVATDSSFTTKVFARSSVPPGQDGRTSIQIDKLDLGRGYYWRARAEDGANTGPFVTVQFEVLPRAQLSAPPLESPINGERAPSKRPGLRVGMAERNAAVGSIRYEFQLARDVAFGQMVAAGTENENGDVTIFTPGSDLASNLMHYWRVRSTDGETTSNWSTTQSFLTPAAAPAPSPSPGPSPGPPPGNCTSNSGPAIIACISAKYPERLVPTGSLSQRQANMEFLRDRIIEAGRCGGMDLAWNLKRGGPEISIDFLVERVGGALHGHDIAFDYDNHSTPLVLYWGDGTHPFYGGYRSFSCQ
jgi:hypothetical protein